MPASRIHPDARDPERALAHFRRAAKAGRVSADPRIYGRLPEVGLSMADLPDVLPKLAAEIRLEDYRPVKEEFDPPGHAFVFHSRVLRQAVYVKFRVEGRRPIVKLYSLHPPDYGEERV